jgi:pyridoxamine 5'-phosphate oxidase
MQAADLGQDPFLAFDLWMKEAKAKANIANPNAMALATVDPQGRPSLRMVLLKDFSSQGFVFFTNFESRKGLEIETNSKVALGLYWDQLGRQVRIEGKAQKLPRNQAEVYFNTRPRGSQCGAWASPQSKEIASREELEKAAEAVDQKYKEEEIPMPPHWGGFCVIPDVIEFWAQSDSRLHDRIVFSRSNKEWKVARLAP